MLLKGVHETSLAEMNQNVKAEEFKIIAFEECAELIKALTKITRGYVSVEEYEELIDTLADNMLATRYYISALGLDEEVTKTIERKHSRNYHNAMIGNFVHRDKLPNEVEIAEKMVKEIKERDVVFCSLTGTHGIQLKQYGTNYEIAIMKYTIDSDFKVVIGENSQELFDIVIGENELKQRIIDLILAYKNFIV